MKLNEFNSLVDLFFYQVEKENSQKSFLELLNPRNKKKFTWGETSENIYKLANYKIDCNNLEKENIVKKIIILYEKH